MACADSVPGISGGTVAYVLGFYDNFINSLSGIFGGNKEVRKASANFLFQLASGWVFGLVICVILLASLFESQIYFMSSAFMGLTLFALPFIFRDERKIFKKDIKNFVKYLLFLVFGILLVVLLTYLSPLAGMNLDMNLNLGFGLYVFFSGMLAISAMVLPGISGSSMLLIFGLYLPIISTIKEVLGLNLDGLPILIIFALGILTGIVSVVKIVKYCLKKYRAFIMAFIFGLVIGSVYAIIMGPATLEEVKLPLNFSNFSWFGFLLGGAPIILIELFRKGRFKKLEG